MNKKLIIFVKEYILLKPVIHMIDDIISDVIIEGGFKYIRSFNNQFFIYDLSFTNIKNNKTENKILENVRRGKLFFTRNSKKNV